PASCPVHAFIGRRPFHAPVEAVVLCMTVAVVVAIVFIVLLAIADDVGRGKAIVRRQEIDRRPGPAMAVIEQGRRSAERGGKLSALFAVAAPEPPQAVAIAIVPLGKARRMLAQLVAVRAGVPGF